MCADYDDSVEQPIVQIRNSNMEKKQKCDPHSYPLLPDVITVEGH